MLHRIFLCLHPTLPMCMRTYRVELGFYDYPLLVLLLRYSKLVVQLCTDFNIKLDKILSVKFTVLVHLLNLCKVLNQLFLVFFKGNIIVLYLAASCRVYISLIRIIGLHVFSQIPHLLTFVVLVKYIRSKVLTEKTCIDNVLVLEASAKNNVEYISDAYLMLHLLAIVYNLRNVLYRYRHIYLLYLKY
nr:MAG TPA: hypothetical protein [Caudoviricetes sp.]DAY73238.1 MAG TPA: hypothetical protein [Caudoviricetes sp.]